MPVDTIPYAELRQLGPFFELAAGNFDESTVDQLLTDPAAVDAAVDDYAGRLHTDRRDIAGSMLVQAWAGRIVSIYAGCAVLRGGVPDLAAGNVRFVLAPGTALRLAVDAPDLLEPGAGWHRVTRHHLDPLIQAVDRRCRAGERRLRGNVAAALAGALGTIARSGLADWPDLLARGWTRPTDLVGLGDWVTTGPVPTFARRTCCNLVRIPGYDLCADCVIAWRPQSGLRPAPIPDFGSATTRSRGAEP